MVFLKDIRSMQTSLTINHVAGGSSAPLSGPLATATAAQRRAQNPGPSDASQDSVDVPEDGVIIVLGKDGPTKQQFCSDLT
eukprot:6459328-Prymnesium_polylepis.1